MTGLVDEITLRVTLNHEKGGSTVYSGRDDLRAWLQKLWPFLGPLVGEPGQNGQMFFKDKSIEVIWTNTGLYEVPEEAGGDN